VTYSLLRQSATPDSWMALAVKQIPRPALLSGAPLQDIQEPVRVVLAAGRDEISDYLELPCAVVSERMRSALDRAGVDNIQYLQATLEQRVSERKISGYWIANVCGALACVDREASVIERESESYAGDLRSFQIDLRATYGLGLFRVAEDRRLIAVHERVRAVLESARLHGVVFQTPSQYDGYPVSRRA
jgi:hypothetical protein